ADAICLGAVLNRDTTPTIAGRSQAKVRPDGVSHYQVAVGPSASNQNSVSKIGGNKVAAAGVCSANRIALCAGRNLHTGRAISKSVRSVYRETDQISGNDVCVRTGAADKHACSGVS